ncbi:DUF2269 domain-containing protein [Qaidamihabitans albus]|uniref:DUF2269 domain-containing protein n=1 Tax=Qaidamihabitans albus TaxID=2795733 RepID=UPI001F2D7E32|nr:DUF2269 domain-containing protein [Qaidamihabitans albus]
MPSLVGEPQMVMSPPMRKFVLVCHVATSVSWLGAVAAYLALDLTATVSQDLATVRAAYVAMDVVVAAVIVPLALASVLIGIVNALGTAWGLFRHYWVLVKLLLTVFATTILLLEAGTVRYLADVAASGTDPRELPGTLLHSVGGSVMLLIVLVLSVYKPRGLTRHGQRKQRDMRARQRRGPGARTSDHARSQAQPRSR